MCFRIYVFFKFKFLLGYTGPYCWKWVNELMIYRKLSNLSGIWYIRKFLNIIVPLYFIWAPCTSILATYNLFIHIHIQCQYLYPIHIHDPITRLPQRHVKIRAWSGHYSPVAPLFYILWLVPSFGGKIIIQYGKCNMHRKDIY